jgi:hypothetical protein
MEYENYIPDALEIVSAWEVPVEDFASVVNDQARLMAGSEVEHYPDMDWPSPYEPSAD